MTPDTITWCDEEWEVVHSSINLGTLKDIANVILRRKPKPLREWNESNYRQHPLWKFLQACRVHLMQIKDVDNRPIFELWGSAHDARDWLRDQILSGNIK